jgi:hypothetical protein
MRGLRTVEKLIQSTMKPTGSLVFFLLISSAFVCGQMTQWQYDWEFQAATYGWIPIIDGRLLGQLSCESGGPARAELELMPEPLTARQVMSPERRRVQADEHGRFDFGVIDPGRYRLVIRHFCNGRRSLKNEEISIRAAVSFVPRLAELVINFREGKEPLVVHRREEQVPVF